MTATPTKAVEVFYSYAQEDELLRNKLEKHLSSLRRQGLLTTWHHYRILPRAESAQETIRHLDSAAIILLLISADFLDSDYCYETEMQRAMERHAAKQVCVIPILLRPADIEGTPFAELQGLPTNGKAITTWPNEDEAFLEITRGVRKAIEAWVTPSISPHHSFSDQYWNVPYQRNPYFTGQETALTHLHSQFRADKSATSMQTQAISGLGGIGKTQLALEYAHRYRNEYKSILWANADTIESLVSDYIALADLLGLPEYKAQNQSLAVEAVKNWLSMHDQWLLILDNVNDIPLARKFLPRTRQGHILLTTPAHAHGETAQGIEVLSMGSVQGTLLLLRRAKILVLDATLNLATTIDRDSAEEIVQILGGLPLALDQAGAYIEETGCGLAGYLHLYRTYRAALLQRRGTLAQEHPESVATTLLLSFEKVEQVNPTAAELLRFCAFLHPDMIPEELITEGTFYISPKLQTLGNDLIALDEAFEVLRSYSLIRRHPDTKMLSVHRLVQAVLRDSMDENQQCQWTEQMMRTMNQVFPWEESAPWLRSQRYILHAQACVALIEQWKIINTEAAELLEGIGNYLRERAQYTEAEPPLQRALAISEQTQGQNSPDTAQKLNNLAVLYWHQGEYAKAESFLQRALAIFEQALEPDYSQIANNLNNLASISYSQGKYDKAELLFQRALTICEQTLGPDHLYTALNLKNLARLYSDQGKYDKAEPLFQRALIIREQTLGPDHPQVANSINNLAALYKDQGKYDKAEPLFQRALTIREQTLGPDHPDTATSINNLATLYEDQAKYDKAESLLRRSLAIYEQALGPNHPQVAANLINLAGIQKTKANNSEAKSLLQRSLDIVEEALGPNHPQVATCLNNLANLFHDQGEYAKAASFYLRAIAIAEQTFGPDHPQVATYLNNLAGLYEVQGKYSEVEQLYRRALAIREQALAPNHRDTASSLNNLGVFYWNRGKYRKAEQLYRRALAINEQALEPDHPQSLMVRANYNLLLLRQQRQVHRPKPHKRKHNS